MIAKNARAEARRTYRNITSVVKRPPLAPPGHYYSPLTTVEDGQRAAQWSTTNQTPVGINMDQTKTTALATQLAPMWKDLQQDGRYHRDLMYEQADAAVYHSMLRHFRPQLVIEIGSGYSTAVALDTIDTHDLPTRVDCIDPNPERLKSLLRPTDTVAITPSLVQDVPLETYQQLGRNDFLFIDSTHVVKAGSDVVWTTLRVLPSLAPGVIVHIHDMFWPLEYQQKWLLQRRDWNEIYLIHAFLSGNPEWEVLIFNDEVWHNQPELVAEHLPNTANSRPGGLWLQKT